MEMGNDPATISRLLRAIAGGANAQASKHDVIFNAAADMIDKACARLSVCRMGDLTLTDIAPILCGVSEALIDPRDCTVTLTSPTSFTITQNEEFEVVKQYIVNIDQDV